MWTWLLQIVNVSGCSQQWLDWTVLSLGSTWKWVCLDTVNHLRSVMEDHKSHWNHNIVTQIIGKNSRSYEICHIFFQIYANHCNHHKAMQMSAIHQTSSRRPQIRVMLKSAGKAGDVKTGWVQLNTRAQNSFTVRLSSKRVMKWSLKTPPHLICIATLPCET